MCLSVCLCVPVCVCVCLCACACMSVCMCVHDCVSACMCVHVDAWSCGQTRVCVRLCAYPRVNARRGLAQGSEGQDPALPPTAGFRLLLSGRAWCTHGITLPASSMASRRTGPRLPQWRGTRPRRLSRIVVLTLTISQSSQGRQEGTPADEVEGAPGPAPGEKTEKRGQQLEPPIVGEPG